MTKTNTDLGKRLAAALDLHGRARENVPEDNPFANHDLERLSRGVGILKGADQFPARNMAEHGSAGYEMEVARNANLREGKQDKSARRMAAARARAAKKVEFDRIAESEVQPSKQRMTEAWRVVFPLVPIVTRIANSKRAWASRFLGSVVDDVAQVVLERMALVIAKSDKYDLDLLRQAADELGEQAARAKSGIPGDQLTEEQRKERRQMARARKWLMGMAYNRVMGTLVDLYTDQQNLRWDNLDVVVTVMASINGVGDDPMSARFKADRAPAFLGTKFQRPDGINQSLIATAINAAITDRGLDLMVEILLSEENRRHNGSVAWSRCAEALFRATPGDQGEWLWDAVVAATAHLARPKRARADAARMHVRNHFEWLPGFVVAVVESFNPRLVGFSTKGNLLGRNSEGELVRLRRTGQQRIHAVMASEFELYYLGDEPETRQFLQPALTYSSVEEAVAALTSTLEILTGADLVNSVVNA